MAMEMRISVFILAFMFLEYGRSHSTITNIIARDIYEPTNCIGKTILIFSLSNSRNDNTAQKIKKALAKCLDTLELKTDMNYAESIYNDTYTGSDRSKGLVQNENRIYEEMKIEKVDEDCDSKEMNYANSKQPNQGSKQYKTDSKVHDNKNSYVGKTTPGSYKPEKTNANKSYNEKTTLSSYISTKTETNKSYNVKTTPSSYRSKKTDNLAELTDKHFDAIFDKYSKDITTKKDTLNGNLRSYDTGKESKKESKQGSNSAYDTNKQNGVKNYPHKDQSTNDSNEMDSKSKTLKGIESFLSKSYSHDIPINSLEHDSYHSNDKDDTNKKKTNQMYPESLYDVLNGSLTDSIAKKKKLEKDILESKLAVQKLTNDMKEHNLYPSNPDGSKRDSTVYKTQDDTANLLVDVELTDQGYNDDWKIPIQQSGYPAPGISSSTGGQQKIDKYQPDDSRTKVGSSRQTSNASWKDSKSGGWDKSKSGSGSWNGKKIAAWDKNNVPAWDAVSTIKKKLSHTTSVPDKSDNNPITTENPYDDINIMDVPMDDGMNDSGELWNPFKK